MFRTTDGGSTWERLWELSGYGGSERPLPSPVVVGTPAVPSASRFPAASSLRPGNFFFTDAVNGFTGTAFTNDGGRTWTPFKTSTEPLRDLRFATSGVAYACASVTHELYRTLNTGRSFERWASGCAPDDAVYLNQDVAWGSIDYFSRALWYTDSGWKARSDVLIGQADEAISTPVFYGFELGWAGATRYNRYGSENQYREELGAAIYRTGDGGVSWRRIPLDAGYLSVRELAFATDKEGWAIVATVRGMDLIRTIDGGESWFPEIIGSDSVRSAVNMFGLTLSTRSLGWVNLGMWDSVFCCAPHFFKHYPGLALTPTVTPTATSTLPPTTPTPTRTPFDPFIPTATPTIFMGNPKLTPTPSATPGPGTPTATPLPPAMTCPWEGAWATAANGEAFTMDLTRQGNQVEGTYHGDRRLSGLAEGNRLTGRWAGPPTFSEPLNAGRFAFTALADCRSFTGTWGYGGSSIGGGAWSGVRSPAIDRRSLVSVLYVTVLGRPADAAGLDYWAGTTFSPSAIEAALRASEEGQRVEAVRALYRELLLRDPLGPDNGGLRSWVDSGLALQEVRASMMTAPEVQRVLAIRALYRELLGRDDDLSGIRYWASSPLTLDQIRVEFMNSDEYRRRPPGV